MNIKKVTKNSILAVLLLAPLSTFALFDFGHDHDDYYYDRPHLFGGYRRGYYADRRYRDQVELDRQKMELEKLDKESEILARKEALFKAKEEAAQKPVVKK